MDILTTPAQQFIADTNNDGNIDVTEVMASMTNLSPSLHLKQKSRLSALCRGVTITDAPA